MKMLPLKNLAPLKPLMQLEVKEKTDGTYLCDQIKEIATDIKKRDAEAFREIAETSEVVSNFAQGKQIFQFNRWTGEWRIMPLRRTNPNKITAINIMQFYLTDNLQRLVASNPDIEPEETYLRSQYRKKVQYAKAVWNHYEKKFYTHWFNQQEALHQILSGTYIESVQYDPLRRGAIAFKDIFEQQELEISPGSGECIDCGFEGKEKDFMPTEESIPQCPECGSHGVNYSSRVSEFIEMPTAQQPVQVGEPILRLIPIQAVRFDLSKRPEDSPYFLEMQMMSRRRLQMLFGSKLNFPENEHSEDRGLEVLNNIRRAGNTISGHQSFFEETTKNRHDTRVERMCLMPEMYAHVRTKKEEKTVDGQTIPADTRLIDLAPKGITIIGLSDFKTVLGVYPNEHHQQELSTGVHHMRLESGVGRGAEDTVEVQKRFNRFDNQHVRIMQAAATPAHTYIQGSVDREFVKQIGHPDAAIPIKQEVASALGTMDLVKQLKPATVAGNFFQYTYDILNQYRQLTAHSTTFTGGLPGVDNQTATGARIGDANAASIYIPMLQIKAEVRCNTAGKTIGCVHRHFQGIEKFYSFGKTASEQVVGEYIRGEDIDPEIRFTVVRDSELPKNRIHQQYDWERMMQSTGGLAPLLEAKQLAPEMFEHVQKIYNQDIFQSNYSTMEDICRDRLDQALAQMHSVMASTALQFGEPVPLTEVLDPELLADLVEPPIDVAEPNHQGKAQWYSEFLDTPEGYNLGLSGREMVAMLAQAHVMKAEEQAGGIGQAATRAEVASQQPIMEQQAEMAGAQIQAERETEGMKAGLEQEKARLDAELEIKKEREKAKLQTAETGGQGTFGNGSKSG